jgi:putative SOS response-associated peptidase YedK
MLYWQLMCYSFTPVGDPDSGRITWLPPKVLKQLERQGIVRRMEPYFPGDMVEIWKWTKAGIEPFQARFDLVPAFFKPHLSKAEMLKEKASRRKGSDGFSSYNARSESMLQKPTWKGPWRERKRMAVPVTAFRERPNEDDAPREFRGREYLIHLASQKNLAGLYERWENEKGEVLDSFGIITVSSQGNSVLESIYHPRCPLILDNDQVEEWLNPEIPLEQALRMIKPYPADGMTSEEIAPSPKPRSIGQQQSLFEPGGE